MVLHGKVRRGTAERRKASAYPRLTAGSACGTVGRARDTERRYGPSSETFTLLGAGSFGRPFGCGFVFLYKAVLKRSLGDIGGVVRTRRPQRLPVVLHVREVKALLRHLEGSHWLAACLMYGSGLRLMEALRLRVKDLDFEHRAIMVRDGKGQRTA